MNYKTTISTSLFMAFFFFLTSCGPKKESETVSGDGTKTETTPSAGNVTKDFLIGKTWKAESGSAPMGHMTFTNETIDYVTGKDPYTLNGDVLDMSAYHIKYRITKDGDGYDLILNDGTKFKYSVEAASTDTPPSSSDVQPSDTKTTQTTSTTNSSDAKYKVGDDVEVYDAAYEKKWFASDILKVKDNKYYIHYHGYDSKWDVWVKESEVRYAK